MKLTIRDIAAAAGVSPATVSRALRDFDNVDPQTKSRILAIAREKNFTVSPTAVRLATGRTGTVGIVTPFVGSWYFSEVFAGIEEGLRTFDVDLLLHKTGEPSDGPDAHVRMRHRVDGMLIIGLAPDGADVAALRSMDVPAVLVGAKEPGLSSVAIDDVAAARTAVEHLVETGHERIALITGRRLPTKILPENDRLRGYLDVLAEHGLAAPPAMRGVGSFTALGGEQAMRTLLARRRPPTAVFCMSDEMAYGAMQAIRRAGLAPGGDHARGEIAVVGFDGHDLADLFDLSTVSQPAREIGCVAARQLMSQLAPATPTAPAGPTTPLATVLPTQLHRRGSTAAHQRLVTDR